MFLENYHFDTNSSLSLDIVKTLSFKIIRIIFSKVFSWKQMGKIYALKTVTEPEASCVLDREPYELKWDESIWIWSYLE